MQARFGTHAAVTPGEWKRKWAGLTLRYGWHDSPFGECLLVASDRGITGLAFLLDEGRDATMADLMAGWGAATLIEAPAVTAPHATAAFQRGGGEGGRLPVVLRGTPFQIKVWGALQIGRAHV